MTDYSTEYTLQELENNLADKTVNPPVLRRGLLGKADDGKYYNIAVNTDGTFTVTKIGSPNFFAFF